jgi:hypothetical protein
MIKGLVALVFLTSPVFAGDTVTVKRSEILAEMDGLKADSDRMTGAAFQFGYACSQAGNTWTECQKMFVDAVK